MDSTTGATTRRSWDGPLGRRILGNSPPAHRVPRILRRETTQAPGHRSQGHLRAGRGNPAARLSGNPGSRAAMTNRHAPLPRPGGAARRSSRSRTSPTRCHHGNRKPRQVVAAGRCIPGSPTPPRSGSRTKTPYRHSSGNPAGRAIPPHLRRRTAIRVRTRPPRPSRPCSPNGSAAVPGRRAATIPPCRPNLRGRHPPTSGRRRPSRIPAPTDATIRRCSDSLSARSTSPRPSAARRRLRRPASVTRPRPCSAIRAPINSADLFRLRSGNPRAGRDSTAHRMAGISPATARKADSEDHHRTIRTGAAEESSCWRPAWRCCWWPVSWSG